MVTLVLYGELADKYGKEHELAVKTFGEAMRAMMANHADFSKEINGPFHCIKNEEALTADTLELRCGSGSKLHLVPKIEGDYETLVAAFVYIGFSAATAGTIAAVVIEVVVSLVLSCVASMLTSTPEGQDYSSNESPAKNPSFLFQGAQNKSEQGGAVPVVHGEMMVGSHTISSEIRMDNTLTIT